MCKKESTLERYGSVWYMCLKIENYCLKIFVKIRMSEKIYENTWNVVRKLKMII